MNGMYFGPFGNMGGGFLGVWGLLAIWSLVWKGFSLWHSATRRQGWWFIALMVFNTAGILDIIYLFGVLKLKGDELIPKK